MNRPGPVVTLISELSLSQFIRHIYKNLTQFGNKFSTRNLQKFRYESVSCKLRFMPIFHTVLRIVHKTTYFFQKLFASYGKTPQELSESH